MGNENKIAPRNEEQFIDDFVEAFLNNLPDALDKKVGSMNRLLAQAFAHAVKATLLER